jgi:integrase
MAAEKLNNTLVSKLPAKEKTYEVRDSDVRGLILRVYASGKKTFILNYARGKKIKIGDAGILKVTEARNLARLELGKVAAGQDPQEARKRKRAGTFTEYFKDHYKGHIEDHQKGKRQALSRYRNLCAHPDIGKIPITKITALTIAKYQRSRKKEGRKESTINREVCAITALVRHAFNMGFIPELPFKGKIKKYREYNEKFRFLEPEEEVRLREALKARDDKRRAARMRHNAWMIERNYPPLPEIGAYSDRLSPLVLTALNTGCRKGELFSLTWQDIDFKREDITIKAADAKSGKTRIIPLPDEGLEVLKAWLRLTDYQEPTDYVFPGKGGGQLDNIDHSFRKLLKNSNITGFRFHDLRHTYASKLVQAGISLYAVKELLGHSEYKTTQRYAHLAPDNLRAAVKVLDGKPPLSDLETDKTKGRKAV